MALQHPYQQEKMSLEAYYDLLLNSPDVRYEYIDGQVYMLAGGTIDHATISLNIASFLRNALRGMLCRVYNSDVCVRVSATKRVFPDVTVSCDARDTGKEVTLQSPRLVIEVLSPATEITDRREKLAWYLDNPTIQEYALVETNSQLISLYRRAKGDLWNFITFKPDNDVEFASIDVRVPFSVIYEDVVFLEETT